MYLTSNSCYRIVYEDYSSITFCIEGEIPQAMHQIRIRDLNTGKERFLFDLLLADWIGFEQVS
jgi:hypothetical protein